MSLIMRKPFFCICEADQHLCFSYTDSTIPLLPIKIRKPLAICGCTRRDVPVGVPLDLSTPAVMEWHELPKYNGIKTMLQGLRIQISQLIYGCTAWFMSDLVGNREDRFPHNEAHMIKQIFG